VRVNIVYRHDVGIHQTHMGGQDGKLSDILINGLIAEIKDTVYTVNVRKRWHTTQDGHKYVYKTGSRWNLKSDFFMFKIIIIFLYRILDLLIKV